MSRSAALEEMPLDGPLVDAFGRVADDLRISVTDRCNFRCTYCMPAEGLAWLPKHEILTFEELTRLLGIFVGLGVRSLKVTGGEPLVRADLPVLIRMFREVGPDLDISLTTNGVLLDRSQVLAAQEKQVKRFLVPITALLGLSVLIALLGIANTLALAVHERTRELGLLRAIGMARSQLRSMIRSEAMIVAALGGLLGVALSLVFGWVLVSAMHGVGVTQLVFPFKQLTAWIGAAVVAGLLAAALPARTASRMDVLEAVGQQ